MPGKLLSTPLDKLTAFNRNFFGSKEVVSYICTGSIGGKASGLAVAT